MSLRFESQLPTQRFFAGIVDGQHHDIEIGGSLIADEHTA
jgi:hypothetical protein